MLVPVFGCPDCDLTAPRQAVRIVTIEVPEQAEFIRVYAGNSQVASIALSGDVCDGCGGTSEPLNAERMCATCVELDRDADALGPCGCIDYHYADCPTLSGYTPEYDSDDDYNPAVYDEFDEAVD